MLDKSAPRTILAIAPAGYGKSALAAQWASHLDGNVCWYSADPSDTPRVALFHIICAVRRVHPNFAPWAEELINHEFDLNETTIRIINEISSIKKTVYFVFENSNLLSKDAIGINQIWHNNIPTNVHQLATLRNLPQASFARAAELDSFTILNSTDLRFTEEEIKIICNNSNLDCNEPRVKKIISSQNGWPAGINYLVSELAKGNIDFSKLDGGSQVVQIAVSSLKPEIKLFLTKLSLINNFNQKDAETITGLATTGEILNELSKSGLFLSKSSDAVTEYEINPLIKNHLRTELAGDEKLFKEVASATANRLQGANRALDAAEIYMTIGNHKLAEEILSKHRDSLFYSANFELLNRSIPTFIKFNNNDERYGLLMQAYANLSVGNITNAKIFKKALRDSGELNPALTFEVQILQNWINFVTGHFEECLNSWKEFNLKEYLKQDPEAYRLQYVLRPIILSAFMIDEDDIAAEIWALIENMAENSEISCRKVFIPSMKAMINFNNGKFAEAFEYAHFAMYQAKELGLSGIHIPFESAYIAAHTKLELGEIDSAIKLVEEYSKLAADFNQLPWFFSFEGKRGLLAIHKGHLQEGRAIFRNARNYLDVGSHGKHIQYGLNLHEILSSTISQDLVGAKKLLDELPDSHTKERLAFGLATLMDKAADFKALEKMEIKNTYDLVIKEMYMAQANISRPPVAMGHIREALKLANNNGYFYGFLTYPEAVKNLILTVADESPTVYTQNLARAIRAQTLAAIEGADSSVQLTKREIDIVRRLATGNTVAKLASQLHISNNTMKTHLKNVYKKLEVDSRTAAVKRAKELGLI